jgi:hypothetical protein
MIFQFGGTTDLKTSLGKGVVQIKIAAMPIVFS